MDDKELQHLIEQLSQQRSKSPGGGGFKTNYQSGGAYMGRPEDATPAQLNSLRQQYQQWAWQPGYGNVGTLGKSLPPSLQGVLYDNPRNPFMMSVGQITPDFANAMNSVLYPGMNFRTGDQSMGEILGQKMTTGGYKLENQIQDQIDAEKQRMSPNGYRLSPEEESAITDAVMRRYGR